MEAFTYRNPRDSGASDGRHREALDTAAGTMPSAPSLKDLIEQAHAARREQDMTRAASLFVRAQQLAVSAFATKRHGPAIAGWAELCRAMGALSSPGGGTEAARRFDDALLLMKQGGENLGALQAEAFGCLARATGDVAVDELPERVSILVRASALFQALAEAQPDEVGWRALRLEADLNARVTNAFVAIVREDFVAADRLLADVDKSLAKLPDIPPAAAERLVSGSLAGVALARVLAHLARERHAWRTLDHAAARGHVERAAQALDVAESHADRARAAGALRATDGGEDRFRSLVEMAASTVDAFEALLDGDLVRANRAVIIADAHARLLTKPSIEPRRARLERIGRLQERRAQVEALAAMIEGRTHPLFAYLADHPVAFEGPLGEQLTRDLSELEQVYAARAWRMTIIGAGSALEGVLLHALRVHVVQASWSPPKDLDRANLNELLTWAADKQLVSQGGRMMSDALRHHRNLVHPGNEERSRYRIDQETAASALTVLLNAVRDLSPSAVAPAAPA